MTNIEQNPYQPPAADINDVSSDDLQEAIKVREEHISHEASIRAIGILYFIGSILLILSGILQIIASNTASPGTDIVISALMIGIGALYVWIGAGLRAFRASVRHVAGVFAAIGLLGFPIGTLINAYILYLLYSKKGKMVFSDEYKEIQLATPDIKYKTSIIVWLFLALIILLIAAAILIPMFSQP